MARFEKPDIESLEKEEDVEGLIKALVYEDEEVREQAALALETIAETEEDNEIGETRVKIKNETTIEVLIEALKDEDSRVREVSTEFLGMSKDKRAIEPLLRALRDEDGHVSNAAVWALGKLKLDERAVEPLMEALNSYLQPVRKVDLWGSTVHNIVVILGEIGDERAVKPLKRIMGLGEVSYYPWSPADDYIDVSTPAEEALQSIHERGK